jgi:hypothetical protein
MTEAELARILASASSRQVSGSLLVDGDPGGSFHLSHGAIIAVESPGAPGVETLLLRSGRLGEAEWAAAFAAGAADNHTGAELVGRTLIGAAELQLVCRMAALDGAFAVGMGRIDRCTLQPGSAAHHLVTPPLGMETDGLLQESERRVRALRALRFSISPFRDRVALRPAGTALLDGSTTDERREILLRVNGRRSSRDLAFLLGRSLYPVTVELSRALGEGLVEVLSSCSAHDGGHRVPSPDHSSEVTQPPLRRDDALRLPRREPGASEINDVLPLRPLADPRRSLAPLLEGSRVVNRGL